MLDTQGNWGGQVLDTQGSGVGGIGHMRIGGGGGGLNTQGSGGCWRHKDRGWGVDTQGWGVCWTHKDQGGVGHKDWGAWVGGGHTRIRGGWVLDTQGSGVGGVGHTRIAGGGGGVLDTQGLCVCVLDTQGFAEPGGTGLVQ